jgi:arylsulfatase A-like enzyme
LGIAEDTIVMYSTDNGAEVMSWPDGGATPFRSEKDTNWEGGWRVPCAIRWPGVIEPGTISNEIFSHTDMLPTLLAAAGKPDIVEKLKRGWKPASFSIGDALEKARETQKTMAAATAEEGEERDAAAPSGGDGQQPAAH